jgi:hypothetical protein
VKTAKPKKRRGLLSSAGLRGSQMSNVHTRSHSLSVDAACTSEALAFLDARLRRRGLHAVRQSVPARISYLTPFSGFQEPCNLRT